jgi:colanic acid/amylovoran biosynthesis glycosyltransferase
MSTPRPAILSYCATFLPREMLHVYRQVTGVSGFENHVVTRTRANAESFPYPHLTVLRKSPWRGLRRLWCRARGRAVPLGRSEVNQVLALAREVHGKVLHVYLGSEALRALELLKLFSGARIVSFHGADLSHEFSSSDYASLWSRAELFLCRSEALREDLMAKGCPADRIRLNYTGVPLPPLTQSRNLPAGSGSRPIQFLQVCRLIGKKGLDVSLRAFATLVAEGISGRLVFAGGGPEEETLRELAADFGVADLVSFPGFVSGPELEKLYRHSDVFLHPSRETESGDREGIPNSLLEAMAYGLPVISTRHSGIPEAITHDESGLLIDRSDAAALAGQARRLWDVPGLFDRLSLGARAKVESQFSSTHSIKRLEDSYDEALQLRS